MDGADLKRKQKLDSAVKAYLDHAEHYPSREAFPKTRTGEIVSVFGMLSFSDQDNTENCYFLAPADAEQRFMGEVDSIFDSQVSPATVRSALQRAINLIHEQVTFVFPFETDDQEQQYLDKLYELLHFYYGRRYDAMVPMYQLECANGVEFPLANAVLCSGGARSRLAAIANNDDNNMNDTDREQIELCSYLKFPVTGDSHSRLQQVEYETDLALQVLRYVMPWFESNNKLYNPAHGVSMWKHSDRVIVYPRPSETNDTVPWYAEVPNGIFASRRIDAELLRYAQEVRGLDDINYHISKANCNPVSQRICRALSFYDSAAQSSNGQFAFGNFIISIDILLPAKKRIRAPVLTSYLGSLIEHGQFYTGEMDLDAELPNPDDTTWPERVRLTTADFEDFYTTRGQILHGSDEERYKTSVSTLQVKKARQIAFNAIRAYAYLARGFHWQNDREAENWFKSPQKPPESDSDKD